MLLQFLQFISQASAGFPNAVEKLPELRALDLIWGEPAVQVQKPGKYTDMQFATATPGVMFRTVQATKKISKLCIGSVGIALTEVVSILKWMGRQLLEFETSVCDQEEAPFERLEILLLTAAEHNNELGTFSVAAFEHDRGSVPLEKWKQQAERVLARLRYLEKYATYLWVRELEAKLKRMAIGHATSFCRHLI